MVRREVAINIVYLFIYEGSGTGSQFYNRAGPLSQFAVIQYFQLLTILLLRDEGHVRLDTVGKVKVLVALGWMGLMKVELDCAGGAIPDSGKIVSGQGLFGESPFAFHSILQ